MSDVRWGILGAANFARNHMGPAIAAAPPVAAVDRKPRRLVIRPGFRDWLMVFPFEKELACKPIIFKFMNM